MFPDPGSFAIVAAHPDDEILWFSSVARAAARIFVCYLDVPGRPDWTEGRRAVATEYPLPNAEFLGISESVAFRGADWSAPVETPYGLEVLKRPGTLAEFDPDRYRQNFQTLVVALEQRLHGVAAVLTHNPWGEYGNEEHVQVYRAVKQVAASKGLDVWYSNYCSDRSYALMMRHVDGRRSDCLMRPTDLQLARRIEALYRQHDCWTWPFSDYAYFAHECFLRDADAQPGQARGSTIPLNYIKVVDKPASPLEHRRGPRAVARRLLRAARRRLGAFVSRSKPVAG